MKKTLLIALVVLFIIIAIVGVAFFKLNKEKTSITASSFQSSMEQKGYTIANATSQFSEYDYITQVYLAISDDSNYQIEFYEFSDENNAMSFYNNNKSIFESSKGNSNAETNASAKNYSKYTLSTNDKYMVVSRIDNTLIYVDVDDDYKDIAKDLLDELGY